MLPFLRRTMKVLNKRTNRRRPIVATTRKVAASISSSQRLERHLGELATRASEARVALRRGGLGPALAGRKHQELRRAVAEMVGNFDVMIGDITARLVSLRRMIETLRKKY
jgi:hypothetical protein